MTTSLVAAVASYGLPGPQPEGLAQVPHESVWREVWLRVQGERLTGFLRQACLDGVVVLDGKQRAALDAQHEARLCHVLFLERLLLEILDRFGADGVDAVVIKGPALAHLDYPSPELRTYGDIDVLVRADQFDQAAKVLAAAGHVRRFPEPRPGFDRRFGKGACFQTSSDLEIDMHRTLTTGPFGQLVTVESLWEGHDTFSLGDRTVPALPREERFLHACLHAVIGDRHPKMLALRDVAQVAVGALKLDRLDALTDRWHAQVVVTEALRRSTEVLGTVPDERLAGWAHDLKPTRAERRLFAICTNERVNYTVQSMATLWVVDGARNKLSYARALALPDRRYVEGRHGNAWRRARHGIRSLRTGLGSRRPGR